MHVNANTFTLNYFPRSTMVPEPLLQRQRWAELAIDHVKGTHDQGSLLWQPRMIGTSSMFSGACYPERALAYIDSARRGASEGVGTLSVSWLWWFGLHGPLDRGRWRGVQ